MTYASRTKGTFHDVYNHEGIGCAYLDDLKINHIIHDEKENLDYLFIHFVIF